MSHLGSYVLYLIKCNFFLFHIANLAIIPDLTNIRFLGTEYAILNINNIKLK